MTVDERPLSVEKRLTLTKFEIHEKPHIVVDTEKCKKCDAKPCIYACPAGLYSLDENGEMTFIYEGCLECGTCRLICPHDAVSWTYPPGGFGVLFKFG